MIAPIDDAIEVIVSTADQGQIANDVVDRAHAEEGSPIGLGEMLTGSFRVHTERPDSRPLAMK